MSMDLKAQQQEEDEEKEKEETCDNHDVNLPTTQQRDITKVNPRRHYSPICRIIIPLLVFIVIPSLTYYYLGRYLVPENPLLEINNMSVDREPLPEEGTEVSKWYVNLTIHNPDKRWNGNFQDVRFRLIREGGEKESLLSKKVLEPFSLRSMEGMQIILNMEEMDTMEDEDWEEHTFSLRMYLKVSFVDSDDSLVDDYWEVRRECSFLTFEIKDGTKGVLKNHVPMWCDDHVRITPHRRMS